MSSSGKVNQNQKTTVSGFITKVISSRVVEFIPSDAVSKKDLTGNEPSFLVLMDDSTPRSGDTCDEARGVELLKQRLFGDYPYSYRDSANDQLNSEGQRQGVIFSVSPSMSVASEMLDSSCNTIRK